MLVLTRKLNERIRIGDGIWVTVLEIRKGRVRLGLSAADEIEVARPACPAAASATQLPIATQSSSANRITDINPRAGYGGANST
jgi:carbon storage regulator